MSQEIKIKIKDLESYKPINNNVLIKVEVSTDKMNNGLLVGDKEFRPADHAERVFKVVAVPDELTMNMSSLNWTTEIEIKPGDLVLTDYLIPLRSQKYCDGNGKGDYRLLSYADIYAIINEDKSLYPLNGYLVCEKVYKEDKALDYSVERLIEDEGIVRYVGTPNTDYMREDRTDEGIEINTGDHIKIIPLNNRKAQIDLEFKYHSILDKPMFLIQRWRVAGILT